MSSILVNKTVDFIMKNSNYNENDLKKIKYGIEGIYLTITKILIILFIGFIFKYLDVVVLTLLFFNILRFFAFGLHAKKSIQCLILSICEFNILPLLLMNCNISDEFVIIVSIISFIFFLLFAPSDTEKRPLTNKRKRITRKISSIIACILLTSLALNFDYLKLPITCSLIIESTMICPLSYKILGLKYNNYKIIK